MAIENIICAGIGFDPGSVIWMPTRGYGAFFTQNDPDFIWTRTAEGPWIRTLFNDADSLTWINDQTGNFDT